MLLADIIAKGLAIYNAFLSYFVTISGSASITSNCGSLSVYQVTLTECGRQLIAANVSMEAIEFVLRYNFLAGLLAVK